MAERKQVALIYDYDTGWIGGTYYILNIIKALDHLPDDEKPHLNIFHDFKSPLDDIQKIDYPYIEYTGFHYRMDRFSQRVNTALLILGSRWLLTVKLPQSVGNFYYKSFFLSRRNIEKYYCWIPDLQPLCLPQFYKKTEQKQQYGLFSRMIKLKEPIIFSSQAALDDFNRFFPKNRNVKKVLRFVSLCNTDFGTLSMDRLREKFGIAGEYFIVCNQFWKHKNHKIVLEAFKELFKSHPSMQLVFTGKEQDYRDPNYSKDLKAWVAANGMQERTLFLGFIDRDEQLKLMAESIAVIQPSLFEGWSTVVEDAKLLGKQILCSDIAVHREQLPGSELFFNPHDTGELLRLVEAVMSKEVSFNVRYDHKQAITDFARGFLELFYTRTEARILSLKTYRATGTTHP